MVAQSSWLSPSELEANDAELWHVMVTPGEVSVLTLEQLDDLYRLDIVDDSTQVWQASSGTWVPLGVVAGVEADPEPASWPGDPWPAVAPANSTIPRAPAFEARPYSVAANSNRPAAHMDVADFDPPETLRPLAADTYDFPEPRRKSGWGAAGWGLVLIAAASGTLLSLYRNDVLREAARSAGHEPMYTRLETALGAPGFGTLRSLDPLRESLNEDGERSTAATPQRAAEGPTHRGSIATAAGEQSPEVAPASPSAAASTAGPAASISSTTRANRTTPQAQPRKASAPAESRKAGSFAELRAQRESAAPRKAPRRAPARSEPPRAKSKGGANSFDPLNGSL